MTWNYPLLVSRHVECQQYYDQLQLVCNLYLCELDLNRRNPWQKTSLGEVFVGDVGPMRCKSCSDIPCSLSHLWSLKSEIKFLIKKQPT